MRTPQFHRPRRLSVLIAVLVTTGALGAIVSTAVAAPSSLTPSRASQVTSTPLLADAGTESDQPNLNAGASNYLSMDASPARSGYYRFQVSVPAGAIVTSALFSCVPGSSNTVGLSVYSAPESWTEMGLTWANEPASGPALGSSGAVTGGVRTRPVDVTSAIHGAGTYTLVTKTSSSVRWSCLSKENSTGNAATLTVGTSATSGSPSPSPSSTAPSTTPAPSTSAPRSTSSAPSTSASPPPSGHKVLVIPLENHSQAEALSQMPHLSSFAATYGQATNYHAIGHPSLPNYLAIWGGSTFGITNDCSVSSGCSATAPSVFGQTIAAGETAKAYQESMSGNCQTGGSGSYAPRHGPWPYWQIGVERYACDAYDVPSGTTTSGALANDVAGGKLPVTGELTPNLCNDAHDCSLRSADSWLGAWLPKIMSGADYTSGRLTVIIMFDEDDSSQQNKVAFVVIDPQLHGKTVSGTFNHYSLTRWLDDNANVSRLRNAAGAPDLRAAFGL